MNNFGHFKGINSKPFGAFKSSGGFGAMQSRVQGRSLNEAVNKTIDGKDGYIEVNIMNGSKYLPKNFDKAVDFILKSLGTKFAEVTSNHKASDSNDSYGTLEWDNKSVSWYWNFNKGTLKLAPNSLSRGFKKVESPSFK